MTQREIFKKYDNLSKNELNAKNNKEVYAKMVLWRLLLNVARLKKKKEAKERFRKKLVIPESEISECPEYDSNQK